MIRVYVVTERADPANQCLVRANSKQQAIRLAAERFTHCELASTDTVMQLMKKDVLIIDAAAEEPVTEELPLDTPASSMPEPRPAEEVFRDE